MMKRLRNIFLFLLLGAIINVAVAWGLACLIPLSLPNGGWWAQNGRFVWQGAESRRTGYVRIDSYWTIVHSDNGLPDTSPSELAATFPSYRLPNWFPADHTWPSWKSEAITNDQQSDCVDARGWPMLSGYSWYRETIRDAQSNGQVVVGFELTRGDNPPRTRILLPTCPLWLGVAVNTLFYAAALWVLFLTRLLLPHHRRLNRIKRGLCPKCGYDLQSSGVKHEACPECGMKTPTRQHTETPTCALVGFASRAALYPPYQLRVSVPLL